MNKYFKLFEEYVSNINEGTITVFPPGNPYKPMDRIYVKGIHFKNGITWKAFYDIVPEWLNEGYAISVITSDFIFGSDEGYNTKIVTPKYRSKINNTWSDKKLPKFLDMNPNYDECQFDIVKVDKKKMNSDGVYIEDKYGNQFCIHSSKVLEIQLGASVRDRVYAGTFYLIDGMRARVDNYQNGIITVSFKYGSKAPEDYREYTLAQWRSKNYSSIDESEKVEDYEPMKYHFSFNHKRYTIHQAKTNPSKFGIKDKDGNWEIYVRNDVFDPENHEMNPDEFLEWIQRGIKYFNIRAEISRQDVIDSDWKNLFKYELSHNKPINKRLVILKLQCGRRNAKWNINNKKKD